MTILHIISMRPAVVPVLPSFDRVRLPVWLPLLLVLILDRWAYLLLILVHVRLKTLVLSLPLWEITLVIIPLWWISLLVSLHIPLLR